MHWGHTKGRIGDALGTLLEHFWIALGTLWRHFGDALGTPWGLFGDALGTFWRCNFKALQRL